MALYYYPYGPTLMALPLFEAEGQGRNLKPTVPVILEVGARTHANLTYNHS